MRDEIDIHEIRNIIEFIVFFNGDHKNDKITEEAGNKYFIYWIFKYHITFRFIFDSEKYTYNGTGPLHCQNEKYKILYNGRIDDFFKLNILTMRNDSINFSNDSIFFE